MSEVTFHPSRYKSSCQKSKINICKWVLKQKWSEKLPKNFKSFYDGLSDKRHWTLISIRYTETLPAAVRIS